MRSSLSCWIIFLGFAASPAAAQTCTFTLSAASFTLDSTAQSQSVSVTASAPTCAWTASTGSGFLTLNSGATGVGNGTVSFLAAANTTSSDVTGSLTIAGQVVAVTQRFTSTPFGDISPSDFFFNAVNLLRGLSITAGCSASPLLYCPNDNITGGQMAIFIIRSILGGDNFQSSATPSFDDVPITHPYFKWIQKMKDLGITAGCSSTSYCPDATITRGQMAVFIVRARYGAATSITYPAAPLFTDVPATNIYFQWIQKMKQIGITAGCTASTYCPDDPVTRGQMAIFVMRGGFNQLLTPGTPVITSVTPASAGPGGTAAVTLSGTATNFAKGTTQVAAGAGISVSAVNVTSPTSLTATLAVDPAATPAARSIIVTTGGEEAVSPNGFTVFAAPVITDFNPKSGPIGTPISLTGVNLLTPSGVPATVTLAAPGSATIGAPVSNSSSTGLSFVVPAGAVTGPLTLSLAGVNAASSPTLTVTPSSTFTLSASPASANVFMGKSVAYAVQLASSSGFGQLAQLTVTGVPAGITASFNPAAIAVGQTSTLILTVPANQPVSTANLSISAAATVEGIPLTQTVTAAVTVQAPTTSFIGRAVTADALEKPLAGVTVTMLGKDGAGNNTGCTGNTVSDGGGNFALANLGASCVGPQLVGFGGNSVTSPPGKYAGVNLVFTLIGGQVVVSPVLVHLPLIDNAETFSVQQNSASDQTYSFTTIPGLTVTVYAHTTFTLSDGTQPNPFPLAAVEVAIDRLPDVMPVTNTVVNAFIVAFQPANTTASAPVAVYYPNTLNTAVGTGVPLMTLDPTRGRMVPYGTGTVSSDGQTIIPDIDPSTGSAQHRYGIVHFDWHGPAPPLPGGPYPGGGGCGTGLSCSCGSGGDCNLADNPNGGEPVDLGSGLFIMDSTDLEIAGTRGRIVAERVYRTISGGDGPFGIGTQNVYDYAIDTDNANSATLINLITPDTAIFPFSRQPDGTLTCSTSPHLRGAVMRTQASGQTDLRLKDGTILTFQPAPRFFSRESAITDANGNQIAIARNPANLRQITSVTDSVGRQIAFTYDANGHVVRAADSAGRVVTYIYNASGTLAEVIDPEFNATKYSYDTGNQLLTAVDGRGTTVLQNTFDSTGRVAQQVQADGGIIKFSYVLSNPLVATSPVLATTVTDPLGRSSTYRFNTQGYVVQFIDALGQYKIFERAAGTNVLLSLSGPAQCKICGPPGDGDTKFTYDSSGNLLTRADALGDTTTYTYEPVYNKTSSITDPFGNTTRLSYDTKGNLVTVTDALNHITSAMRDSNGLILSITDAGQNKTVITYDQFANPRGITDALGNAIGARYDALSQLVELTDPVGRKSQYTYDRLGRVTSETNAKGEQTVSTWDPVGNLLLVTDARNKKTVYTYDVMNREKTRTVPLGQSETFSYDLNGNLIRTVDRRGQTSQFQYDALNRAIGETYQDGIVVTHSYDSYSRLIQTSDPASGLFTFSYDAAGRLSGQTGPLGAIQYTRDALGRVATRQVVGQPAVSNTFDAAGNLVSASSAGTTIGLSYDQRNALLRETRPAGLSSAYSFDLVGRLSSITHSNGSAQVASRTYSYDESGHRLTQGSDSASALTTASVASVVDDNNQLVQRGNTSYAYDQAGNRVSSTNSGGTTLYQWDARNRLQKVANPDGSFLSIHYNSDNDVIQVQQNSVSGVTSISYILDDAGNIASLTNTAGRSFAIISTPVADDHLAAVNLANPGQVLYRLRDANNSTIGLVDQSGSIQMSGAYEPYGQISPLRGSDLLGLTFTGRPFLQPDLGQFRARFLDPVAGRFLSEDPSGLRPGSANLYGYASNSPIDLVDPTGDESAQCFLHPASDGCKLERPTLTPTPTPRPTSNPRNNEPLKPTPRRVRIQQQCRDAWRWVQGKLPEPGFCGKNDTNKRECACALGTKIPGYGQFMSAGCLLAEFGKVNGK